MNKVMLIGRLTADPEMRQNDQMAVTRYTVAVDRRGKDAGADFVNCVTFGKVAEFASKYLHKGMKIAVAGRIHTSKYQDTATGKTAFSYSVIVEEHEFCESRKENVAAFTNDPLLDEGLPWG